MNGSYVAVIASVLQTHIPMTAPASQHLCKYHGYHPSLTGQHFHAVTLTILGTALRVFTMLTVQHHHALHHNHDYHAEVRGF